MVRHAGLGDVLEPVRHVFGHPQGGGGNGNAATLLVAQFVELVESFPLGVAIMRDANDPEALIAAEDALSQRQADLDSLRAQHDQLGDRIDYSCAVTQNLAADRRLCQHGRRHLPRRADRRSGTQ